MDSRKIDYHYLAHYFSDFLTSTNYTRIEVYHPDIVWLVLLCFWEVRKVHYRPVDPIIAKGFHIIKTLLYEGLHKFLTVLYSASSFVKEQSNDTVRQELP